jgi:hypothetical protein
MEIRNGAESVARIVTAAKTTIARVRSLSM